MAIKKKKIDTQRTPGFKHQMRIGAAIARALGPPVMAAKDCAELFGISPQMLRRIECQALYKITARIKAIAEHEDLLIS